MTNNKGKDEMILFKLVQSKLRDAEKEYLKARIHMEMFINKHPHIMPLTEIKNDN